MEYEESKKFAFNVFFVRKFYFMEIRPICFTQDKQWAIVRSLDKAKVRSVGMSLVKIFLNVF